LWTPLLEAAAHGHARLVAPLVAAGADVDAGNVARNSALYYACSIGSVRTVKALVGAGSNLEICNPAGRVALHSAAEAGSLEVVKLLVQAGAEVTVRDVDGETPAVTAERNGHGDIAAYLRRDPSQDDTTDDALVVGGGEGEVGDEQDGESGGSAGDVEQDAVAVVGGEDQDIGTNSASAVAVELGRNAERLAWSVNCGTRAFTDSESEDTDDYTEEECVWSSEDEV
jgi:ankyrin repeat protein